MVFTRRAKDRSRRSGPDPCRVQFRFRPGGDGPDDAGETRLVSRVARVTRRVRRGVDGAIPEGRGACRRGVAPENVTENGQCYSRFFVTNNVRLISTGQSAAYRCRPAGQCPTPPLPARAPNFDSLERKSLANPTLRASYIYFINASCPIAYIVRARVRCNVARTSLYSSSRVAPYYLFYFVLFFDSIKKKKTY